ncbi:calcium-binding protein, partial [Cognatishimia sp. F0-27]|uniref:calcium-binding protein n=1 Tax=Cognatishimia sp. F0-27 TaxID=2816855 RepID=UPI001D0CBD73
MSVEYVLVIDGVPGDPALDGAFALDDFGFSGRPNSFFEEAILRLSLNLGTALPTLVQALETGTALPSVQIIGRNDTGRIVYDLRAEDVELLIASGALSGQVEIRVQYTDFQITTNEVTSDLYHLPARGFSRNEGPGSGVDAPDPTGPTPAADVDADQHWIRFDGLSADASGNAGGFEIISEPGFEFTASEVNSGTYVVRFDPQAASPEIFEALTTGRLFSSVQIFGGPDGATATPPSQAQADLRLENVRLLSVALDAASDEPGLTAVLVYEEYEIISTSPADGDTPETQTQFSWNALFNLAGDGVAAPDPGPVPDATYTPSDESILIIDGLGGPETAVGMEGAFRDISFAFNAQTIYGDAFPGGIMQDNTLSVMQIAGDFSQILPDIYEAMVTETPLASLQIRDVVDPSTDGTPQSHDLRLEGLRILSLAAAEDGITQLLVEYDAIDYETIARAPDGTQIRSEFQWDVVNDVAGTDIVAPVAGAAIAAPDAASTFGIFIDGVAVPDAAGIPGILFLQAIPQDFILGGLTSVLVLDLGSQLAGVLGDIAPGTRIDSIRIVEYGAFANGPTVPISEVVLGDVAISVNEAAGIQTGISAFPQQFEMRSFGVAANGDSRVDSSFSWNLSTQTDVTSIDAPVTPVEAGMSARPDTLYMLIDGIAGNVQIPGLEGAFELNLASYDVNPASYGEARSQIANLSFDPGPALLEILETFGTGGTQTVQVLGFDTDAPGAPELIYDLRLAGSEILAFSEGASPNVEIVVAYDAFELITTNPLADTSTSTAWDLITNQPRASITPPVVPMGEDTSLEVAQYLLLLDGVDSGQTGAARLGAFELDTFSFGGVTAFGNGSGAEVSGRFILDFGAATPQIVELIADQSVIPTMQIVGLNANGDTVYDLRVADTSFAAVAETSSAGDLFDVLMREIDFTIVPQNPDGSLATPRTFQWNFSTGTAGDGVAAATVPARPDNTAPVARNITLDVDEDSIDTLARLDFSDAETGLGDLSVEIVSGPTLGDVVLLGNDWFSYTPDPDANGADSFTYRVTDADLVSEIATATITVRPVNDRPVFDMPVSALAMDENQTAVPLVTASDVETAALDYTIIGGADSALFGIDAASGALRFLTAPDFEALGDADGDNVYVVEIAASDGALSGTTEVQITLGDVNEAPVAVLDPVATPSSQLIAIDVLTNDFDPEGTSLTLTQINGVSVQTGEAFTLPSNARVWLFAQGVLVFDPTDAWDVAPNTTALDTFTYGIEDISGLADVGTVTVTLSEAGSGVGVIQTGTGASEILLGSAFNDILTGLAGADTLISSGGNDSINGGAGNDTIKAGAGHDTIEGGAEGDAIDGGDGRDTLSYASSATRVAINLGAGFAGGGDAAGDSLTSIENLRGSAFNDILRGDGGANVIEGGAGPDVVDGQGGSDTVSYEQSGARVAINLGVGFAGGGDAAGDSLTSIENLRGSAFNDILRGDGGANVIEGGAGPDVVDGQGGSDTASYEQSGARVAINL